MDYRIYTLGITFLFVSGPTHFTRYRSTLSQAGASSNKVGSSKLEENISFSFVEVT